MTIEIDDDDHVIWLRIPMRANTAARLHRLSTICEADQSAIAASLLHDVLMDDALAHGEVDLARLLN